MSVRVVKEGEPQNKQDLDRASAEINRAKNQWREKWVAKAAIIATWKIENAAGNVSGWLVDLWFNVPVNSYGIMSRRSVNISTLFLGRLKPKLLTSS